ncbi:MAG: glycine cleavage system aminomethyltransferase GcvT [Phycisphaerae bacterium]
MNRTALNEAHRRAGAKLVDFAGWEMPLLYEGIVQEHRHTRAHAGAFDVSHMGRFEFHGPDAGAVLQRGCTRNLSKMAVGRCGYAHVCNAAGGVLDDVIVSRFEDHWHLVCNASNRSKLLDHFKAMLGGHNVTLTDRTLDTCMIAVQGPRAMDVLAGDLPFKLAVQPSALKRYAFAAGSVFGVGYMLARTGYTGEDGFELTVPAAMAPMVWDFLVQSGARGGPEVRPIGLGARDTLRLEAGMCLYGHELSEEVDPITAGCQWCVDLSCDFIGAGALRDIAQAGPKRKLVGLELEGRRIARPDAEVSSSGAVVGRVTSGSLGPTVGKSIAMAYVAADHAENGRTIQVELKNATASATIVPLPFYKRTA